MAIKRVGGLAGAAIETKTAADAPQVEPRERAPRGATNGTRASKRGELGLTQISLELPKELHRKLKTEAFEKDVSMSEIIRSMLTARYR